MKTILLFILSIFLSISSYSQLSVTKKPTGGKRNSVRSIREIKGTQDVPTEGDGTGDKIRGQKSSREKNVYNNFIRQRQKYGVRRYHLKSAEGKPLKPGS
jgi:hypothetical protein